MMRREPLRLSAACAAVLLSLWAAADRRVLAQAGGGAVLCPECAAGSGGDVAGVTSTASPVAPQRGRPPSNFRFDLGGLPSERVTKVDATTQKMASEPGTNTRFPAAPPPSPPSAAPDATPNPPQPPTPSSSATAPVSSAVSSLSGSFSNLFSMGAVAFTASASPFSTLASGAVALLCEDCTAIGDAVAVNSSLSADIAPGLAQMCDDCAPSSTVDAGPGGVPGGDALSTGFGLAALCDDCTAVSDADAGATGLPAGDPALDGVATSLLCDDCTADPVADASPPPGDLALGLALASLCDDCVATSTAAAVDAPDSAATALGIGLSALCTDCDSSIADANPASVRSAQVVSSSQLILVIITLQADIGRLETPAAPWAAMATRLVRPSRAAFMRTGAVQTRPSAAFTAGFVSLGRSSGPGFEMMTVSGPGGPQRLAPQAFVLEPVRGVSRAQLERELTRLPGRRSTQVVDVSCLEFAKPPPPAGMVYRLAPADTQRRHTMASSIVRAADRLHESGRLTPDIDAREYLHAIRQWAVWTAEQSWRDEAAYARAFLDHSRKNLSAAGRPWTRQIEDALRQLVPNRWRDIQAVLTGARGSR